MVELTSGEMLVLFRTNVSELHRITEDQIIKGLTSGGKVNLTGVQDRIDSVQRWFKLLTEQSR